MRRRDGDRALVRSRMARCNWQTRTTRAAETGQSDSCTAKVTCTCRGTEGHVAGTGNRGVPIVACHAKHHLLHLAALALFGVIDGVLVGGRKTTRSDSATRHGTEHSSERSNHVYDLGWRKGSE